MSAASLAAKVRRILLAGEYDGSERRPMGVTRTTVWLPDDLWWAVRLQAKVEDGVNALIIQALEIPRQPPPEERSPTR